MWNEIDMTMCGNNKYIRFEYGLNGTVTGGRIMHRKHWYKTITEECPVCGRGRTYRERQYTPKPADSNDRYEYTPYYDHCEG